MSNFAKGEYAYWHSRECIVRIIDTPGEFGLVEENERGVSCIEPVLWSGIRRVYIDELEPFTPPSFPLLKLAQQGYMG